jgi:hypothetical protein
MVHFNNDECKNLHISLTLGEHGYSVGVSDTAGEADNSHIPETEP